MLHITYKDTRVICGSFDQQNTEYNQKVLENEYSGHPTSWGVTMTCCIEKALTPLEKLKTEFFF